MPSKSSGISQKHRDPRHILLVDPRPFTRACVARFLRSHCREFAGRKCEIVQVANVRKLVTQTWPQQSVDLAILNIGAASVLDVPIRDEIERLRTSLERVPVVLLAESESVEEVRGAFLLGVRGYIPTSLEDALILVALRLVLTGGIFVPAEADVIDPAHSALRVSSGPALGQPSEAAEERPSLIRELTQREKDVLDLLRRGKSNKAIAYELSLSESTVKVHIQHIMRKLKATNRTHAVCLANAIWPASRLVRAASH